MATLSSDIVAFILGAASASAFFWLARRESAETYRLIIRHMDEENMMLRKELNEIQKHQLTEAVNPPDWWTVRAE